MRSAGRGAGHAFEHDDVALAAELLLQPVAAEPAEAIFVGPDDRSELVGPISLLKMTVERRRQRPLPPRAPPPPRQRRNQQAVDAARQRSDVGSCFGTCRPGGDHDFLDAAVLGGCELQLLEHLHAEGIAEVVVGNADPRRLLLKARSRSCRRTRRRRIGAGSVKTGGANALDISERTRPPRR